MDFVNYLSPAKYEKDCVRLYYRGYLSPKAQKPVVALPEVNTEPSSLDDLLGQESKALLDRAVGVACGIVYRLQLYRKSAYVLEQKWNELSRDIGELSGFKTGYNMNVERKRSMLLKERNSIELAMLENKHETWKDLNEPTYRFTETFHKAAEAKNTDNILKR